MDGAGGQTHAIRVALALSQIWQFLPLADRGVP